MRQYRSNIEKCGKAKCTIYTRKDKYIRMDLFGLKWQFLKFWFRPTPLEETQHHSKIVILLIIYERQPSSSEPLMLQILK